MGTVGEACQNSDVVVVASPVDRIAELVASAAEHSPDHCLITDVGSTKQKIVASVGPDSGVSGNSCQHIRSPDLRNQVQSMRQVHYLTEKSRFDASRKHPARTAAESSRVLAADRRANV